MKDNKNLFENLKPNMHRLFHVPLLGLLLVLSSCGKKEKLETEAPEAPKKVKMDWDGGGIADLPGGIYRSSAESRVNWQPWSRASLKKAEGTSRLVLAFVVSPNYPSCGLMMDELENSAQFVQEVNENYVPVLIDGNISREMVLLAARLCGEVRAPLEFPVAIWITPKGAPVAWLPISSRSLPEAGGVFLQSHTMVSRMWREASDYVEKNSEIDQANRATRIQEQMAAVKVSEDVSRDAQRALRQAISFYDPYSRTLDQAGGVFPTGALDLFSQAASTEALPRDIRVQAA